MFRKVLQGFFLQSCEVPKEFLGSDSNIRTEPPQLPLISIYDLICKKSQLNNFLSWSTNNLFELKMKNDTGQI